MKLGQESIKTKKAISSPTVNDLYWAAGFLEGEGSFTKKSSENICAVQVESISPLEKLQEIFGGRISIQRIYKGRRNYQWFITGARARGVMMTIYKLMSTRRKEQIRQALIGSR